MEEIPVNTEIPVQKTRFGTVVILCLTFLVIGILIGYVFATNIPGVNFLSQTAIPPKVTCTPRPACLDQDPRCLIPETPDMCPPAQSSNTLPTPTVQIITGEKEDYRLQIPTNWVRTEGVAGSFTAPDGSSVAISISESGTESLTDYLLSLDKLTSTSWEGKPSKKIYSTKTVTIAGLPGVERIEEFLAADFTTIVSYTLVNNKVYSFYVVPLELPYDQTQAYASYFDILATFEPISK